MKTVQNKSLGVFDVGRSSGKRTILVRFKIVLCLVFLILAIGNQNILGQGVGISEVPITPDGSSILELRSSVRGFLAPRMTTLQRTSLGSPVAGLLVYDTDTKSFWYWDSNWKAFPSSSVGWGSSNQLLGMNLAGNANEYKTLQGIPNQINVVFTPNLITLSTPQDIHTGATPTFAGLTLTTTPLGVSSGGTGLSTFGGNNTVLFTSAPNVLNWVPTSGAAGQFLQTTTAGSAPTWKTILAVANGGLGQSNPLIPGGVLYGSTATAAGVTAAGSTGQMLRSTGSGMPIWSTPTYPNSATLGKIMRGDGTNWLETNTTYPNSTTINQLLYSPSNNTISGLPTLTNGVLVTDGTGVPQWANKTIFTTSVLTNGHIYVGNASDVATDVPMSGDATIINTGVVTVGRINGATVPVSGSLTTGNVLQVSGANSLTYGPVNLGLGSNYVTGKLPIGNGGTNSSVGLSGQSIMISNGSAIVQGEAGTTTTVLHGNPTGAPSYSQVVNADIANGTIDLTAKVTGELPVLHGGTGLTTFGGANTVLYTSAANNLSWVSSSIAAGQFLQTTTAGSAPTWKTILAVANGGLGQSNPLIPGGVLYGSTATAAGLTAAGSTGQMLRSTGSGMPIWSTPTYPNSATLGKIMRGDGTNWLETNTTYPNSTTINQLLYSPSNNTISGLTTLNNGVLVTDGTGVPQWANKTIFTTSVLTNGHIYVGNASDVATDVPMSGDATIINTGALTLANTAVTVGSYGDATHVGNFTVDSKGRLTFAGSTLITGTAPGGAAGGDLTGTYPNPTLITTGVIANTYGSASEVGTFTVDSKGRLTSAANTTISIPASAINNATISAGSSVSGSNTGDQTITLTGDVSGSGTGSFATTLANTAVAPGSYGDATHVGNFTVDSKGRLTFAGSTLITGAAPGGAAGGDLSGNYPNPTVSRINGATLGMTIATDNNVLIADGTQWNSVPVSGDATVINSGALTLAITGVTAQTYGDGNHVGQFTVDSKGRITNAADVVITGVAPTGPASGDLTGNFPSPTVSKINGVPLGTTIATLNNILVADGTQWNSVGVSGDATISNTGVLTISNDAITTNKIANLNVTTGKLALDAVTNAQLADNSVQTENIVDGQVQTLDIADANVTAAKLTAGAGTAGRVGIADAAGVITYGNMPAGSITGNNLTSTDLTVTGGTGATLTTVTLDIANNAVTNAKMADNAIGNAEMLDNAIGNAEMLDNAINTNELVNSAVTTAKIADANVTAAKLTAGAGTAGRVGVADVAGVITYGNMPAGSITGNNLTSTDLTVTGGTGATLTTVTLDIANNAVTNAKMADNAIGNAEMADNAIGNAEIQDNAVTTAEIGTVGAGDANKILTTNGLGDPQWELKTVITVGTASQADKWTTARNLAGNSVDGSANVNFTNKFIVQGTADAGLTGAQFLGALGNGLLKNTTTTGVLSIAAPGTDYMVPNAAITAGTNTKITYDTKGLVTGSAAAVLASADYAGQGSTTSVLHGGGAGNPSWSQIVNADIDAAAGIVDTKLATISTAGKVSNSATTATSANTANTIVSRDASGNFSAGTISANLSGNATTATSAISATTANTATNLSGGAGGSISYQSAANTTAMLANGTAGQILKSNGGTAAPSWTTPTNGTVTSVSVVTANGFQGTVATATTTPAITLSTSLTQGSVPFIGASGALTEDNANLFWDNTNKNLGIGTASPEMALHIVDATAITSFTGDNDQGLRIVNDLAANHYSLLGFGGWSGFPRSLAQIGAKFTAPNGSYLFFGTSNNYNDGITNEAMVIDYNGKVGIGETNPTALLHLNAGTATANTAPLKFTAGTSLTAPEAGAVEYDGTNYFVSNAGTQYTLAKTLTATLARDFPSTGAQNSSDLTITVTGAASGDAVILGVPNASVLANTSFTAWVSAANTVTIRFNNYSSGALDPANGTFRVSVLKY